MDTNIIILIMLCSAVMAVSAFFSASETALFSIPRERIDTFQNHGARSRRLIYSLLMDGQRTLLLLLLCNLFVNITLTGLIHSLVTEIFGKSDALRSFIAATAAIIMFGEVLPKTGALRWNEPMAALASPILHNLKRAASPLLNLIQRVNRLFLERFKLHLRQPGPFITIDELKSALRTSFERGAVSKSEQGVITELLDRGALPVTRFMVHRSQVPFLPHYTAASDALKELVRLKRPYALVTRGARGQQVAGVVGLPDLLSAPPASRCRQFARPPQWVPSTIEAADLVSFMFAEKQNVVCVLDEFGELSGIFTLEDGLSRIMNFRHERPSDGNGGRATVFTGLQEIDAMEGWLPESLKSGAQNVRTLNGLLTRHLGRIPKTGEHFEIDGQMFYIITSGPSRIESVLIRKTGKNGE